MCARRDPMATLTSLFLFCIVSVIPCPKYHDYSAEGHEEQQRGSWLMYIHFRFQIRTLAPRTSQECRDRTFEPKDTVNMTCYGKLRKAATSTYCKLRVRLPHA